MRILILHNAYAQRGGEDAVVEREGAALRARGHEVRMLVRDSSALHASVLRGAAETLLTLHNPDAARELARVLRSFRPDVVHVHNLFPRWGLSALRVLRAARVPTVQTLHNFRWLCAPATLLRDGADCRLCASGDFRAAVRFRCMHQSRAVSGAYAAALATNRASHLAERTIARFVCVSEFVRRTHQQAGFAPGRLVVKGHFVPRVQPGDGDGSVIFVGRLSEEKGLHTLLRALGDGTVPLKVVGDGPSLGELKAHHPKVRFLGALPPERVFSELARSSVCVVPSIGSETFGLSALEALACGTPVVASDAGALPELVRDGVHGWIVPRGDARALAERVHALLQSPERARAFAEAGLALVERAHLPHSNMARLEAIYREASGTETSDVSDSAR